MHILLHARAHLQPLARCLSRPCTGTELALALYDVQPSSAVRTAHSLCTVLVRFSLSCTPMALPRLRYLTAMASE